MTIQFQCWIPEYGQCPDDNDHVDAFDHEHAAEVFMGHYERRNAEYPVGSGEHPLTVVVRGRGIDKTFTVSGEAVHAYYAQEQQL